MTLSGLRSLDKSAIVGLLFVVSGQRDPQGRNREHANTLRGQGIDVIELDVTKDDSVERAVRSISDKADRIDVLINNAGIA